MEDIRNTSKLEAEDIVDAEDLQNHVNYAEKGMILGNMFISTAIPQ